MLREPEKYKVENVVKGVAWLGRLPDWFLLIIIIFVPNDTGFYGNLSEDSIYPEGR
jgi:hypothetical protein